MKKRTVFTPKAPEPVGPYSQATVWGDLVFVSGCVAIDPTTGQKADGSIVEEATLVLDNLKTVLDQAGAGLESVLKTTVFLKDMNDFPELNKVYAGYFPLDPPARSCVEVARLPLDFRVEVEAIAHVTQ